MQRIIKFRGKRVDNGEWVYGYYTEDVQWDVDDNNRIEVHYIRQLSKDGEFYEKFEVDPATVGQFTGLTDKKGKEIYEGDINQDGGILIWNEDDASFCWEYKDIETHPMSEESEWCKVIGNIHENPELCKG